MKDTLWIFRSFGIRAGFRFIWDCGIRILKRFLSRKKLARCSECGGQVDMIAKPGRTRQFKRGVHLLIPRHVMIPTCVDCGEEFMIPEVSEVLDHMLAEHITSSKSKTIH